jgi:hypothetical protein
MSRHLAPILALLLAAPALAQPAWRYRCPESGTQLHASDGEVTVYRGADPRNPLVCLTEGGPSRLLGLLPATEPGFETLAAQLPKLFPAIPDDPLEFSLVEAWGGSSIPATRTETWRLVRLAPVEVPAGRFHAALVERAVTVDRGQPTEAFLDRLWFDAAAGVPLRLERELLSGVMVGNPDWRALAITPPGR